MFTRVVPAVVNVYLTVFPFKAFQTITLVSIRFVPTVSIVLTRVRIAVVDVPFALNTRESRLTLTSEPVDQVVTLLGVVAMARRWIGEALVDLDVTVDPLKPGLAVTLVTLSWTFQVLATASVLARVDHALIYLLSTCWSSEALGAIAEE